MKKFIISFLIMLCSGTAVLAQPPGRDRGDAPGKQKIEALYVAYITRELKLTETEAQKFWPIHSQYDEELKSVKRDASELDRQQTILNIKKKYEGRFSQVIGTERTNEFFRKDAEFRKRLVERVAQSRRENMDRRRPDN